MSKEENFIPGIYNYCDSWCERCSMTSRCRNYARLHEEAPGSLENDPANAVFWQKLAGMFEQALEMTLEAADQMGLEPAELLGQVRQRAAEPERKTAVVHLILHLAASYADLVDGWFCREAALFEGCQLSASLRLLDQAVREDEIRVTEAVEVIRWYQHQIRIKLYRAVESAGQGTERAFDVNNSDADGSAKVALLGIERSLKAWRLLLKVFPQAEPSILLLVRRLRDLYHRVEAEFPRAHGFVRPGFD